MPATSAPACLPCPHHARTTWPRGERAREEREARDAERKGQAQATVIWVCFLEGLGLDREEQTSLCSPVCNLGTQSRPHQYNGLTIARKLQGCSGTCWLSGTSTTPGFHLLFPHPALAFSSRSLPPAQPLGCSRGNPIVGCLPKMCSETVHAVLL